MVLGKDEVVLVKHGHLSPPRTVAEAVAEQRTALVAVCSTATSACSFQSGKVLRASAFVHPPDRNEWVAPHSLPFLSFLPLSFFLSPSSRSTFQLGGRQTSLETIATCWMINFCCGCQRDVFRISRARSAFPQSPARWSTHCWNCARSSDVADAQVRSEATSPLPFFCSVRKRLTRVNSGDLGRLRQSRFCQGLMRQSRGS